MPTPDNFYSFSSHRPQTVFTVGFRFQTGYACEKWPTHEATELVFRSSAS